MMHIPLSKLNSIRKKHKDKKIVFCSGCFDLTHAGHVAFFEKCKKHGDILVVMIGGDRVVQYNKGAGRPIMNEQERAKIIGALKPVNYCIIDTLVPNRKHPLAAVERILQKLKPDIYVINHDTYNIPYRKELSKKHGATLFIFDRRNYPKFRNLSTTEIIKRIRNNSSQ